MNYTPPEDILEKYANVLVNFALNSGKGLKPREVVILQIPECAKPMLIPLRRAVLKAEAFPITQYLPDGVSRDFYEHANDKQLQFFPEKYLRGKVDQADHFISLIADTDMHELEGIDPAKIMLSQKAIMPYKKWRDEKENAGKLTWTLALYGTETMAKEANMPLKDYWDQIIVGCYLDNPNPIATWQKTFTEIERLRNTLNELQIEKLHIEATGTNLYVGLGKGRQWLGGSGRNLPSFEVFISPDWRKTEGIIYFNEPLYIYGNLIQNIQLTFKKGKVVKALAKKGEKILQEMIKAENADKIGEFSLTDSRLSRITKFMAETLFDENIGGAYGNTHLALGSAYKESFTGDPAQLKEADWEKLGYNDSVVHTDIVSTTNRIVTAYLPSGEKRIIYKNGKFTV